MGTGRAFTLVEVLFTVVIIAACASYALPSYFLVIEKSRAAAALELLLEIHAAQRRFYIRNLSYADRIDDLDIVVRPHSAFGPVAVSGGGSSFSATLSRATVNPSYTLSVDQTAAVLCIGSAPANVCNRLGF